MNSIAAFSIVLHDLHGAARLARFFHSLAAQCIPLYRLEVCLVDTGTTAEVLRLLQRFRSFRPHAENFAMNVIPARGAGPAKAWNLGLEQCTGLLAACAMPGLRLDPNFVTRHLAALRLHPEADIFCADFVQSGEQGAGVIRSRDSLPERLRASDALGPLPVFTAKARRICNFREASPFPFWELGIQAVQSGLRFRTLPGPLYSVTAEDWRPCGPAEELARLVTRQSGFFHVDQIRWALGVLRRRAWALIPEIRQLPSPREIRRLMERRVRADHRHRFDRTPADALPGSLRRYVASAV